MLSLIVAAELLLFSAELELTVTSELLEFATLELLGGAKLELETSTELLDKELLDKKLLDEDEKSSSSGWPVLLEQAKTRKEPKIAKKIEKRSITPPIDMYNVENFGNYILSSPSPSPNIIMYL